MIKKIINYLTPRKNAKHPGLDFAFKHEGRSYFSYGDRVELPIARMGEIMKYQQLISAGVTAETLNILLQAMIDEIDKLKGFKNQSKEYTTSLMRMNRLCTEIMFRRDSVVPTEILYNYLASVFIRDDEDPATVVNDIHHQKVKAFKTISEKDYAFFFANSKLKESINWLNITEENYPEYLNQSQISEIWTKEILKIISSWNASSATVTI